MNINCNICCVDKNLGDMAFLDFCPCIYCKDCTRTNIYIKLDENESNIICMNTDCKLPISDGDIRALLNSEYQEKYNILNLRNALLIFNEYKMCPKDGCPGVLELIEDMESKCIICKYKCCFKCFNPLHPNMTCNSYSKYLADLDPSSDNYEYEKWKIGKKIKTCPKCNWVIHKIGGCNRMICGKCGIYFCWICKVTLPKDCYNHFEDTDCNINSNEIFEYNDELTKTIDLNDTTSTDSLHESDNESVYESENESDNESNNESNDRPICKRLRTI